MTLSDTTAQPDPKPNDKPAVWSMVMQDMLDRDRFGLEKYGTRLQPFNGRDALVDAYQEALDLVVYLRTAIYERDNPEPAKCKGCYVGCMDCRPEFAKMVRDKLERMNEEHSKSEVMPADFGHQHQLNTASFTDGGFIGKKDNRILSDYDATHRPNCCNCGAEARRCVCGR